MEQTSDLSRCGKSGNGTTSSKGSRTPPHTADRASVLTRIAPSARADIQPVEAGSARGVRTSCREKGGTQTMRFEDVRHRVVVNLQDPILGELPRNLSGTSIRVFLLVPNHFVLIFLGEPVWVGMGGMRCDLSVRPSSLPPLSR